MSLAAGVPGGVRGILRRLRADAAMSLERRIHAS